MKIGEVYNQRYVFMSRFVIFLVEAILRLTFYVPIRYVVIKKLGWGHFSTVWMVKDRKAASANKQNQFFALKVQKSAEHYTEAAMDEVELLDCIAKERKSVERLASEGGKDMDGIELTDIFECSTYAATLHDSFFHTGPNGRHMCMVFSMLGCNLLSVIKAYNYRGIPIPVVKNMIKGICKGLDFLHRKCHIIHTDLKPENVLLQFEGEMEPLTKQMATLSVEHFNDSRSSTIRTITDIQRQLENESLTQDARKKLRRKLKKKRQKERKKAQELGDSSDGTATDYSDDDNDSTEEDTTFLSDTEMSRYLAAAGYPLGSSESGKLATNVKRRLSHSAFVTTNFGHRHEAADAKLMEVMRDSVSLKRLSKDDMTADLQAAESDGGVAEVTFLLRAFTPEGELAEGISSAFDDIGWEFKDESTTREW